MVGRSRRSSVRPLLTFMAPVAQAIHAGQELAARRRAHRRDVEVGEPDALVVQPVEVRRLQHRIAVAGQLAVALVVGDDDEDVGLGCWFIGGGADSWKQNDRADERQSASRRDNRFGIDFIVVPRIILPYAGRHTRSAARHDSR